MITKNLLTFPSPYLFSCVASTAIGRRLLNASDAPTDKSAVKIAMNFFVSSPPNYVESAASAPCIPSPNTDIDTPPVTKAIITLKIFFIPYVGLAEYRYSSARRITTNKRSLVIITFTIHLYLGSCRHYYPSLQ